MLAISQIKSFIRDEDGVATVDFVVMTAAGVATAVALTDSVRDIVSDMVDEVGTAAAAVNTSTSFSDPAGEIGGGQGDGLN